MEVRISNSDAFFFEETKAERIEFGAQDYEQRLDLLVRKINEENLDAAIIYGDREHFANIEYFSSYDCRFEEALLIVGKDGGRTIIVGNEGWGYSFQIPYRINRLLYQNFSLQGQPRNKSCSLISVMEDAGLRSGMKVGLIGYKYFYGEYFDDPEHTYDIPAYIVDTISSLLGSDSMKNVTEWLTGFGGIRLKLRTAKEIAWAEYNAVKCSRVLLNILKGLREGLGESEAVRNGAFDFTPQCMFGLANFGPEHVAIGLRSSNDRKLNVGEVIGVCYGIRGSLCSRNGVAAYDEASYSDELRPHLEDFYKPYWSAVATWLESVKEGAFAGEVYEKAMSILGDEKFHVTLNPGHNIGTDEWVNSPFFPGSDVILESGTYLQSDMIGSDSAPVMSAICEDTIIIAGKELRDSLKREYPDVYSRIIRRQQKLRELVGISFDESVLPLCNITGVYFPFMLNLGKIFTK